MADGVLPCFLLSVAFALCLRFGVFAPSDKIIAPRTATAIVVVSFSEFDFDVELDEDRLSGVMRFASSLFLVVWSLVRRNVLVYLGSKGALFMRRL